MGQQWRADRDRIRAGKTRVTPGEPWLARTDWAERKIRDGGRAGAWLLAGFALFWNAIGWTVTVAFWLKGAEGAPPVTRYLVMIFPGAGLLLLAAAVKAVMAQFRYGTSVLELATLPAPPGRLLAGVIETRGVIAPEAGFRIRLSCLRRVVRGSGKNRSTSEDLLWQDERIIPGATRTGGGIGIPFAIPIPADALESNDQNPRDRLAWRLTVDAEVPGVDYNAGFDVPVFRTPESDTPLTAEEIARLDPSAVPTAPAPASRIGVTRRANGLEVQWPAGRAPRSGWGVVVALLGWTAMIVIMVVLGAPTLLALFFGLFDLIFLFVLVQLWLLESRVEANREKLVVRSSILGFSLGTREVAAGRVARIEAEPGFRSGTDTTWDLVLWLDDQSKIVLGRTIPTRREAEWLATEIRNILSP